MSKVRVPSITFVQGPREQTMQPPPPGGPVHKGQMTERSGRFEYLAYNPASEPVLGICGDVWFRQGPATGEREPRMLLRPR